MSQYTVSNTTNTFTLWGCTAKPLPYCRVPFYDGLWHDPTEARTDDLLHERWTLTTKPSQCSGNWLEDGVHSVWTKMSRVLVLYIHVISTYCHHLD